MKQSTKIAATIGVLAIIATAGIAGTFAGFSANETTTDNKFDTGNVAIDLSAPSTLGGEEWSPGDSSTGTLTVTNAGKNKIKTLTIEGDPGTGGIAPALGDALQIRITEGDTEQVPAMSLNEFNATDAFTLLGSATGAAKGDTAAESHTYTITLSLPASVGNQLKDLAGAQSFTVRAVQRDGTARSVSDSVEF